MPKKRRKKKVPQDDGPGFVQAIRTAQDENRDKFVGKFGMKIEMQIEGGEIRLRPSSGGSNG